MRNQGRVVAGIAFIGIGLLFLVGTVFRVDVWAFCLPIGLIVAGAWLLLRPSMVGPDTRVQQKVLGDIRRKGAWDVVDEEIWLGVGDVRLDLTEATIPTSESRIQVFGLVGSVARPSLIVFASSALPCLQATFIACSSVSLCTFHNSLCRS